MIWDIDHLVSLRNESELWDLETLRDALNMLRRLQGSDYQGAYKIETVSIQELTESTAPALVEKLPTNC